jgi:hypothetical protein
MPKMNDRALQVMLSAQNHDAMAAVNASKLSLARSDALAYYQGDMSKDMPSIDGRSQAVSMDVADTIEGMMPQLIDIFCGSDEVVRFSPTGPEDVAAAEQETDYVNHVFMNKNPGFLVLYSMIKDALLSKVGVVKVWWETFDKYAKETYTDKTDDEFALIVADPDIEVIEHIAHEIDAGPGQPPVTLHDVTVQKKSSYACARVMGVPPEEFGIERSARSIRDANYCFHKVVDRSEADLIEMGYDKEQIKRLPTWRAWVNTEEINRDTVDEHANAGAAPEEMNSAARTIEVIEHYVRMDYQGNGRVGLYRVVTGGVQGEVLKLRGKPDIAEIDVVPFAAMTPVIITHRFFGRSIADLVMDIQRIKTALLRANLDNAYMANNPRVEVSEAHASDDTLDDLLVSRPGGIVRTRMPGGLNWQVVPTIGSHIYPLLEYMDATREWRTGVTRQGQGIDANALQNQSATAVNQVFTQAQARVKLIAKIFAETGIRDLFWLLHATIKKHADKPDVVRLRNAWIPIDPRNWKTREDISVQVGLGSGSKAERMAHMMAVISLQKEAMGAGLTSLVNIKNLHNSAKQVTKLLELNPDDYFTDPGSVPQAAPQPQQPPRPDPKAIEAQGRLALDGQKLQGDLALKRQQMAAEIALKREQMLAEIELKREQLRLEAEFRIKTVAPGNVATKIEMGGAPG